MAHGISRFRKCVGVVQDTRLQALVVALKPQGVDDVETDREHVYIAIVRATTTTNLWCGSWPLICTYCTHCMVPPVALERPRRFRNKMATGFVLPGVYTYLVHRCSICSYLVNSLLLLWFHLRGIIHACEWRRTGANDPIDVHIEKYF